MIFCKKLLGEILETLRRVETKGDVLMATVQEQLDAVQTALDSVSAGLDNIAADEAKQTQMIMDLKAIIDGGGVITPEQLQPLVDSAKAMEAKTKALADSIPDDPAVP